MRGTPPAVEFGKVAVIVIAGVFLVGPERPTLGLRQSGSGAWSFAADCDVLLSAPPTQVVVHPCEGIESAKAIDTRSIARNPVTGAPVKASSTLDDLICGPVIQNDVIGADVMTCFGLSGAADLMLFQAKFVASPAGLAVCIGRRRTTDQTEASVARVLATATGGIRPCSPSLGLSLGAL